MGKILTAAQLEKRLAQTKAREAYGEAQAKNPVAKPYKKKPATEEVWVRKPASSNIIVKVPVSKKVLEKITPANYNALNYLDKAVALPAGASIENYKGNARDRYRIVVSEAITGTPTPKNTPWGTRVTKMIDNSYSFPYGIPASSAGASVENMVSGFNLLFKPGGALASLIVKEGSFATLYFSKEALSVVRKGAS